MRKFLILLITITYLIINQQPTYSVQASNNFARIETTTPIYKSLSGQDTIDNVYCLAEKSYFVEIIGNYDDYYRINLNQ